MNRIRLQQVIPAAFAGGNHTVSGGIREVDIDLAKGQYYLMEAVSGKGKTSLCSFLYGYRTDYAGTILFDDEDVKDYAVPRWTDIRRNSLSMLFQDLRLFTELTVLENIRLKNDLTGFKGEDEILSLCEQAGIMEKINEKAGKLSFGQQQRVAFVRALCQPYDFVIMDEPVSHLDNTNSALLSGILTREADRQGAGVLVTSIGRHPELPYHQTIQL